MVIGVDIDGCVNNQEDFVIDYGPKYIAEHKMPFRIKEWFAVNSEDVFGWGNENAHNFWEEYRQTLVAQTRPFCAEVLNKLKKEGHQIVFITARFNGDPWWDSKHRYQAEEITKKQLRKNKIKYDKLIFSNNKVETILQNGVDIMIEDDINNIKKISKVVPVIMMNTRTNADFQTDNAFRAFSWYDIYLRIQEFLSKQS